MQNKLFHPSIYYYMRKYSTPCFNLTAGLNQTKKNSNFIHKDRHIYWSWPAYRLDLELIPLVFLNSQGEWT